MILETITKDYKDYSITEMRIEPPLPDNISERVRFGIDPGTTKLGLAYLWRSICHIYEVRIVRSPDPVVRILLTQDILSNCFHFYDYAPLMVIEGSAFSDYREAELSQVRTSAVLWAVNHGIKPQIIPPLKIRKQVLGSGKLKPEIVWGLEEFPDAANALCCCYYSI